MQAVAVETLVGQTLGSYHIERLLGQGRLSAVYLGRQAATPVAVTTFLIPATFSAQARERFLARFRREAQALVSLNHPRILPIYAYGVEYGHPYLVTPYAADGSLANVLKQRGRCTPVFILQALEQIAAALDYAHAHGVVHGTLKPANVLLHGSDERDLQVAGFSLVRILEMRGIEQSGFPYAHLLNIAGTFLGTPEYIAPECVQGQPADARSDIYALGILLFELLSGKPPFTGSDPVQIALQHGQQPLPSLRRLCPDVAPALEVVVNRALARDPAQRFQHAGELAAAFAQALSSRPSAVSVPDAPTLVSADQFSSKIAPPDKWQILPPFVTGHLPAVTSAPLSPVSPASSEKMTGAMPRTASIAPDDQRTIAAPVLSTQDVDAMSVDPFEWWSRTFTGHLPSAGTLPLGAPGVPGTYSPVRPATRQQKMNRRQVVAALAAGGLLVAGFGGLSLAHMLEHGTAQTTVGTTTAPGSKTTPTQGQVASKTTSTPTSQPTTKPTQKPTAKPTTKPTATSTPGTTPTSAPSPTPTPTRSVPTPTPTPTHTGTVIGHTSQPTNTATSFTNPSDNQGSLLIHLPNGNFAAYEKACTHQGVPVYYDGGSHQLVCPAHGARFDPANGGNVLQGPASRPLPSVAIHIYSDGTITAG
ncbi:MAG TPA: protein kinase [Ktedonobacteraceae bacterium]|nr:protein kinase [Ktedonobacteraceae bacterium]